MNYHYVFVSGVILFAFVAVGLVGFHLGQVRPETLRFVTTYFSPVTPLEVGKRYGLRVDLLNGHVIIEEVQPGN